MLYPISMRFGKLNTAPAEQAALPELYGPMRTRLIAEIKEKAGNLSSPLAQWVAKADTAKQDVVLSVSLENNPTPNPNNQGYLESTLRVALRWMDAQGKVVRGFGGFALTQPTVWQEPSFSPPPKFKGEVAGYAQEVRNSSFLCLSRLVTEFASSLDKLTAPEGSRLSSTVLGRKR